MARFLMIPAAVTNSGAGTTPWSFGVTGFSHRWDSTLITDPVGSTELTLNDSIGTLALAAPASGTKVLTASSTAMPFNYMAISSGSSLGYQPSPAGTAGFTDGFTVVLVTQIGAGNAVFASIGGYAFEFGGNGKINIYNYAATTNTLSTASNGTGLHIIVAALNGASTAATVDGTVYTPSAFATPATYRNLYLGGGTNNVNAAIMAVHPSVLSASDRLTVYNTIKTQLGL